MCLVILTRNHPETLESMVDMAFVLVKAKHRSQTSQEYACAVSKRQVQWLVNPESCTPGFMGSAKRLTTMQAGIDSIRQCAWQEANQISAGVGVGAERIG